MIPYTDLTKSCVRLVRVHRDQHVCSWSSVIIPQNGTILDPLVLEYIAYRNVTEIMLNDELLHL